MKKIYKLVLISLGVFLFLLVAGTNLILKGIAISSLEEVLSKKVSISSLWLNPFTGTFSSHNVIIWNDEEKAIFSLKSIKINTDPIKLFKKKLLIKEVQLTEPTINLIHLRNNSKVKKDISPQIEKANTDSPSQGFIREIEIKDIAVEKLTFIRPKGILRSMNTINLKLPASTYEKNELNFSANLNILGSGFVDIKVKANTENGALDTYLTSQGFQFNNSFSYSEDEVLKLSGNIKGDIFLQGNYLKKEFQVKGSVVGSKVLVEDKKGNQLLNSENISIDLMNLTFPKISLNLKKLEVENTHSNLSILQKERQISVNKKKQEIKPLPAKVQNSPIKDIIIDEITVKRSSLTYGDLVLTDINLSLEGLKNIPGNKASAAASFTLNDSIDFSSKSLVEVLEYSREFDPLKLFVLNGDFILKTPSLELPESIKNKFPYETEIRKIDMKGDYSFTYPSIKLKTNIITENLKLIGKKEQLHNILLKSLYGNCFISYNLDDNSYSLSGPLNLKAFNIKNKKDRDFFMGDLSVELGDLTKDMITLDSVISSNFFLDLNTIIFPEKSKTSHTEKIVVKKNSPLSKEEEIEVMINNLKLKKGEILTKDLSFRDIYLDGNNISNKKINSNIVLNTFINDSTSLKGNLNIKVNDMDTFSDLTTKGNIAISNLDLKMLTSYVKDFPYEMKGIVNYSSFLDYSKDSISSKGDFSGSNLYIKKNEIMEISMENIKSKLDFNLKKGGITLSNSSFSILNLKGKTEDETKVQLVKGDIAVNEYSPKTIKLSSISLSSPLIDFKNSPETNKGSQNSNNQKEEEKEKFLPVISITKIKIKDGKVIYRKPPKTSIYENIGFSATNFATQKNKRSSINADLSLAGVEKIELNGNLELKEDWDFSPKTITFKGNFNVTKLKIPDFNNLLRKNLPNEFDGGLLSSKGKIDLKSGQLNSEHDITISKIDLGKSTGYSKTIPLGSIIKALTNKYGDIYITIPITGDLTNPKLGVTTIITSSLMSGLVKAAKSPQTIISNILTLGDDEINTIYFQYLSGIPDKPELYKLNKIANILIENPKSMVTFTLYTNENIEKSLITTKSITGIFLGEKTESVKTLENLIEERKKYLLEFFKGKVSSERVELNVSKDNKPLPQAKADFKE